MATRKWGAEKIVNSGVAGMQGKPSVASLDGGGFVIVWEDPATPGSTAIRAQRYDELGNKLGAEISIASTTGAHFLQPSVTATAQGGFCVTWVQDESGFNYVLGAVYNAGGGFVRNQPVIFSADDDTAPQVARMGPDVIVAWERDLGAETDVAFRIFNPAGNGSDVFIANTTTAGFQLQPSVAARPNGTQGIVVWSDSTFNEIRGQMISPAGGKLGSEFTIATAAGLLGVFDTEVVWLNNAQFAVVWREFNAFNLGGNQLKVKVFDGQTTASYPMTDNILVNSTSLDSQQNAKIVALPNGGFAIVWEDTSGVGGDSDFSIKLQVFDASGGKIGGEFLVNTTTTGVQFQPSISALADGRIVVTWTDRSEDNLQSDVRMQIIDPRDGVITGTANAERLYGHDLVNDEISGAAGNDFLFGLKGNDALYGGDGDDQLYGGAGDDLLFGDNGNDVLRGEAGADEIDGGAGSDTAYYNTSKTRVTVSLDGSLAGTGDAADDTFLNVENLAGTEIDGAGDTLRGDDLANSISGLRGNDTLEGLGGNDRLIGGAGADTLSGGLGNDMYFYYDQSEGSDTIIGFSSNASGNNDVFRFKGSAFGGLAAGALAADQFQATTSDSAGTELVRFFYETDTGILRYDADGSNAGAAIVIATLQGAPTVALADFLIF